MPLNIREGGICWYMARVVATGIGICRLLGKGLPHYIQRLYRNLSMPLCTAGLIADRKGPQHKLAQVKTRGLSRPWTFCSKRCRRLTCIAAGVGRRRKRKEHVRLKNSARICTRRVRDAWRNMLRIVHGSDDRVDLVTTGRWLWWVLVQFESDSGEVE